MDRDYSPPEPRPDPVEPEFVRSAPRDEWSPQERSFSDAPRDADSDVRDRATQAEPSAPASSDEPAPERSDERQTG